MESLSYPENGVSPSCTHGFSCRECKDSGEQNKACDDATHGDGRAILTTGQQLAGALGIVLAGEFLMGDGASLSSPATYVDGLALQVCAVSAALCCAVCLNRIPTATQNPQR